MTGEWRKEPPERKPGEGIFVSTPAGIVLWQFNSPLQASMFRDALFWSVPWPQPAFPDPPPGRPR
jgi:hypothetical protein